MADNVNKEAEETKNKRRQLENRGDVELEIRMHFRLVFGFDKGKLFWKAKKQDVMINSFSTVPGFNLELLGVKPTYRRDEENVDSVVGTKEIDIAKEAPYLLESVNNGAKAILSNSRSGIAKILIGGVKNSLQIADRLKNKQYGNSYRDEEMLENSNNIFSKAESILEGKEYNDGGDENVGKYITYLSLFDHLNEIASASPTPSPAPSSAPTDHTGEFIIIDTDKYCIAGPIDEKYGTYSVVQIMEGNGTTAKFMIKKIKNIEKTVVDASLGSKPSDEVREIFINTLYTAFVNGKGTNLYGNINPENVTQEDKDAVAAGRVDKAQPFYKEVDAVVNAFEKNLKHAFETTTDISDEESHDLINADSEDEKESNEDYWETDNIYDGISTNYPMIEMIKRKSYIEVVVDNVRIRKIIKAKEMFEINDSKLSGKPDKIMYRITGKSLGQHMRERVEAGQTRIYVNYQEYHPNQAAAFLSFIMPDLIIVTARTPNNTLGKVRRFLDRAVNPAKGEYKKLEDTAVAAKIKKGLSIK